MRWYLLGILGYYVAENAEIGVHFRNTHEHPDVKRFGSREEAEEYKLRHNLGPERVAVYR